jgi:hypothetical protein
VGVAAGAAVTAKLVWDRARHWDTRRPPTGMVQKVGSHWIYQNQSIEADPPNSEHFVRVRGDSVFIVFSSTGEFASVGCALSAGGGENTSIIVDDKFIVYRGSWSRTSDGTIVTRSKLAHGQAPIAALADEQTITFRPITNVVSQRGLLEGGGSSYVQLTGQEIRNLDIIPRMIAADNR